MKFPEDITKKIGEAVDATAKGAEKVSGMAKLKYSIITKQSKLNSYYESVGKLTYDQHINGDDNSDTIEELYSDIAETIEEIDRMEDDMKNIRNIKFCCKCGEKIPRGSVYCNKCGAAQEKE